MRLTLCFLMLYSCFVFASPELYSLAKTGSVDNVVKKLQDEKHSTEVIFKTVQLIAESDPDSLPILAFSLSSNSDVINAVLAQAIRKHDADLVDLAVSMGGEIKLDSDSFSVFKSLVAATITPSFKNQIVSVTEKTKFSDLQLAELSEVAIPQNRDLLEMFEYSATDIPSTKLDVIKLILNYPSSALDSHLKSEQFIYSTYDFAPSLRAETPFYTVLKTGNIEKLKSLISFYKANQTSSSLFIQHMREEIGSPILHYAYHQNFSRAIKPLVEIGANIDALENSNIYWANDPNDVPLIYKTVVDKKLDFFQKLLNLGANINFDVAGSHSAKSFPFLLTIINSNSFEFSNALLLSSGMTSKLKLAYIKALIARKSMLRYDGNYELVNQILASEEVFSNEHTSFYEMLFSEACENAFLTDAMIPLLNNNLSNMDSMHSCLLSVTKSMNPNQIRLAGKLRQSVNKVDEKGQTALFYVYPDYTRPISQFHQNILNILINELEVNTSKANHSGETAEQKYLSKRQPYVAEQNRKERERELARLRAKEEEKNKFNWVKALALGAGFVVGGGLDLPPEAQADIISGIIQDGFSNDLGISNSMNAANRLSSNGTYPSTFGQRSSFGNTNRQTGNNSPSNSGNTVFYNFAECTYDSNLGKNKTYYYFLSNVFDWPTDIEDRIQRAQHAKNQVLSQFGYLGMDSSKLRCSSVGLSSNRDSRGRGYAERRATEKFQDIDSYIEQLKQQASLYNNNVDGRRFKFTF